MIPGELMAESPANTNTIVVIPTAGLGSRMGHLTENLNKSLLPYKNKPVISHIIDQFPKDTRFIIPVGHFSDQVIDFLTLSYSDRQFEFVTIDDYSSNNSGPGYTFTKCINKIDAPFWYIPCDTYFDEIIDNVPDIDTVFVKKVPIEQSSMYTMFKIDDNKIVDMTFKQMQDQQWSALTGVMYIHDWQAFINRLLNQSSPEIVWAISNGTNVKPLDTWLDFGNYNIYLEALNKSQLYNFSKSDEITYICNGKVLKWYNDRAVAEKKLKKINNHRNLIPSNCQQHGQWLAYDYVLGDVVYTNHTQQILMSLLAWLDNSVWNTIDIDISNSSMLFYKTKTIQRINKFLEKYPNIEHASMINGRKVKHWEYYISSIDWDLITKINLPSFIHGDLHFDNIIMNKEFEFKIIDWRHEFADLVELGDIYYDLAKLIGGFIINYSKIKQNNFTYTINDGIVILDVPCIKDYREYIRIVKEFIESKGWNYDKVKLLVPIIFWNMSPLHTPPFDKFLWYLGIMLFEEFDI